MSNPKVYMSPSAVAKKYRAGQRTVRNALRRGDLKAEVVIKGPSGDVIAIGILDTEARRWNDARSGSNSDS